MSVENERRKNMNMSIERQKIKINQIITDFFCFFEILKQSQYYKNCTISIQNNFQ